MIQLEDVTRTYGQKVAVDRLNLSVPTGELFAFLGPNGAGKTTTIKMIVGLLRATRGTVRVCGINIADDVRSAARLLGYLPDEPVPYGKLTGREFLEFVGQMREMSAGAIADAIERETHNLRLDEFLDTLSETYSHGMRQRLCLASALLHNPRVLVVDEPTVGLDPRSVRMVKDLLKERAAAGTTVFMSTHTLPIAEEIADRIGIVDHGRLNFIGTRQEVADEMKERGLTLERFFLDITEGRGPRRPHVFESGPLKTTGGRSSC